MIGGFALEATRALFTSALRERSQTSHALSLWGRFAINHAHMDRRLAQKNIRTALIAGAISVLVFGASFIAASIY